MTVRRQLFILSIGIAVPLALAGSTALALLWGEMKRELGISLEQRTLLAAVTLEHWIDAQRQPLRTIAAFTADGKPLPVDYMNYMVAMREHWIDLRVVDAREHPAGERREHVPVHARARPGLALPAFGGLGVGAAAAGLVGAVRDAALGGLAPAEPSRVVEGHAHRDREVAVARRPGLGGAPEGSGGGVGVLVVLGGAVVLGGMRDQRGLGDGLVGGVENIEEPDDRQRLVVVDSSVGQGFQYARIRDQRQGIAHQPVPSCPGDVEDGHEDFTDILLIMIGELVIQIRQE